MMTPGAGISAAADTQQRVDTGDSWDLGGEGCSDSYPGDGAAPEILVNM